MEWWGFGRRKRKEGKKCELEFIFFLLSRGREEGSSHRRGVKKKTEKNIFSPCPTLADQYLPMGATFSGMPQGPYSLLPESYSKKPGFVFLYRRSVKKMRVSFFHFFSGFFEPRQNPNTKKKNSPSSPTVVRWLRSMPLMYSLMSTTHEVTSLGQPDLS